MWQAMETLLEMLKKDEKSPDIFIVMQMIRYVTVINFFS